MHYNSFLSTGNVITMNCTDNTKKAVEEQELDTKYKSYSNDHLQWQHSNDNCYVDSRQLMDEYFQSKIALADYGRPVASQYEHAAQQGYFESPQRNLYSILPSLYTSKEIKAVIPSKRAAQNRAAQKAFRLRKERYVKDLEHRVKLMDKWQIEMERLRLENQQLRLELGKPVRIAEEIKTAGLRSDSYCCIETTKDKTRLMGDIVSDNTTVKLPSRKRTKKQKTNVPISAPVRLLPRQTSEASLTPIRLHSPEQIGFQRTINDSSSSSSSDSSACSDNFEEDIYEHSSNRNMQGCLKWKHNVGSCNLTGTSGSYVSNLASSYSSEYSMHAYSMLATNVSFQ